MQRVQDIRKQFIEKLASEDFIIDKSGVKTIEIVGATFIADEDVIFGSLNTDYAQKELKWYKSQSLNVYDMSSPPQIWQQICDKNGFINSNYGYLIYSKENDEQYKNCLRTLRKDKDTRRAMMIYTRPSIQYEFNRNGMSDFLCTNTVQIIIRDNKLNYILNQRSCDAIFGAKNDLYWARYVQSQLVEDLKDDYSELKIGNLIYQIGSLHIYERHFQLVKLLVIKKY